MIETPRCPNCGRLPVLILDAGHQAFCGADACPVLSWDTYRDREWLLAHATEVTIEQRPLPASVGDDVGHA